ncbi:EAL domain-containing protein [Acaryochloris sp. IP29b_bin.148]|uniref:EAL domain-containing protein n=1 Tax=Acaryochloris sp. IP29b_bin.148 TaxID=2969218 RepID=UPI00260D2407|nr:EAL domain-containing protein [Acaryochloris sp. IP29b_bin.148]
MQALDTQIIPAQNTEILMIEDDFQDVEIVTRLLGKEKQHSILLNHCPTLNSGLDTLKEETKIDLILLDLSLSDTHGLETFRKVHDAFPSIPLVILSGNSDERLALEAMQEGAQDFLVKGRLNSTMLSRAIQYAMERQNQRLELEYKNLALKTLSQQLAIANQELQQLAVVDELTQISNRRRFDEVFLNEWNRLLREEQPLALIMCDVDHFKAYNDTYGYQAGDLCLESVAQAIAKVVKRPADCVARYGGEEFVIVLPNTDLAGATHVAKEIWRAVHHLNLPHATSSISSRVTLSLGVACQIPNDDLPPSVLIDAANRAVYAAKATGRDRIHIHHADCAVNLRSRQTLLWLERLQNALKYDQFELYAQPIQALHASTSEPYFEILLRLCDQPGIVCSPGMFFPVAEQYNFMPRLDRWVIKHLFANLGEINALMLKEAIFFINLSGATFKNMEIASFIATQLARYNLKPEQFCFEVSESVAFHNIEAAAQLTQALKDMGCKVALDDFGSGLSSFTHLKNIPADFVKIDGSFIKDVAQDEMSKGVVAAIHHLSKIMGLQTIAEYVENRAILNLLNEFNIDFAQGHYFSPARPLVETLATWQATAFTHQSPSAS